MSFYFIEIDQKLNWSLNSNVNELESNVNQLEANLGGVKFGIDSEGNYGYIKAGADTVIPFIRDINIGDKFNVSLTGSHNITTTATVCYIDKTTICLLGDISLGKANMATQRNYSWNYTVNINNKEYTGTCRIPTIDQICSKCAGYKRDSSYWTSSKRDTSNAWFVGVEGRVDYGGHGYTNDTLPFIEITL